MSIQSPVFNALASILLVGLLTACSSSEERQAKYIERAQALYDRGDYEKAGIEVRNVLQMNTENSEARYLWALIQEKEHDWQEMLTNLSLAVEFAPDFIEARIKLGQLFYRREAFDQALEQADAVLAIEPENAEALLSKARLEMAYENPTAAIPLLRTVIKNEATLMDGLLLLAQAYEATGKVELALENYRSVLAVSRDNETAVVNVARLEIAQKSYNSADKLLESYSKLHPENLTVSQLLVRSYTEQGKSNDAIAVADALAATDENRASGLYLKGRVLLIDEDYTTAAETFEQVLQQEPGAIEALKYLVRCYLEMEQPEKASQYLVVHIEKYPGQAHAHEVLASLYRRTGNMDAAIRSYEEALTIAPQRLRTYLALAQAQQESGDLQAAVAVYNRALEQSTNNISLLILKAGVYERIKNFKAAVELYELVLSIDESQKIAANNLAMILVERFPSEENYSRALAITESFESTEVPTFINTRGWVYYQIGNYANALPLLERAVATDTPPAVFHYHLGMTYFKLNRTEAAIRELSESLRSGEEFFGKVSVEELLRVH